MRGRPQPQDHLSQHSAERICDIRRGELVGRQLEEASLEFFGVLKQELELSLCNGSVRHVDLPLSLQGSCIKLDIYPHREGLWLILRDLSSRQAIEQQLRERDEILTMAEQSAGIGVWDIDLATQTVRGTQQFWRVMGLPPTEEALPIETTRRLRLPEDGERVAKGFRAILDNHAESFEMEYRIRRPDDEVRWIFGRGRLVRDVAGQPTRYSGIDIDVTERKSAEAALADLNQALEYLVLERTMALEAEMARRAEAEEQLHHVQKMETIGQLSGGLAHDFNNLLTVISGSVEAIERHLPDGDPRLRRFALAAKQGVERATALTNRLLSFARRQALEPKLLDINRLILGMSDLLHGTLGEAITAEMRLADDLPPVFVDPSQLETAILNLAVDARDAMPEGGRLTIETARASFAEMAPDPGEYVRIAVTDCGSGMSADTRARAFEPFFTTKQTGEGTGLGLAQVYGFIKQSGGHCRLDSEPGKGTTVILYLASAYQHEER